MCSLGRDTACWSDARQEILLPTHLSYSQLIHQSAVPAHVGLIRFLASGQSCCQEVQLLLGMMPCLRPCKCTYTCLQLRQIGISSAAHNCILVDAWSRTEALPEDVAEELNC